MARVAFLVALRGQGNGMPLTSADLVLLQETIERCVQVIDSHSLQKGEVWRREAAFIYLMIYLNDLLQTLKRLDHRIGFTDDVVIKHQTERGDVTDLVKAVRNYCCHTKSSLHEMGQDNFTRMCMVNPGPPLFQ